MNEVMPVEGREGHTDAERLAVNLYLGDRGVNLRCATSKMVTVRKPHTCFLGLVPGGTVHEIQPGSRARYDSGLAYGEWETWYTCAACLDREIDALRPEQEED